MNGTGAVAAVVLAVVAACSGDDASEAERLDPDERRFCQLVEDGPATPDPFESGIGPDEVERRLGVLRQRFDDLAAVAPDELSGDLEELGGALAELDEVLAAEDHDLAALAETSPDLSRFDDPRFEEMGGRIADHRADVCEP